jgi:hypothetical protein
MVLAQGSEPHLINSDFEDGFSVRESAEVTVANGWDYGYLPQDRQCPAPCSRPEFKPEMEIIGEGGYSQRWFTTYARQFAYISQRVAVQPGQWYEFECMVYAISEPMGQMAVFVGINPWGNSPFHRTMVWGKEQVGDDGWIYRRWVPVSVVAQAWSGEIVVAVAGNNEWPTRNNAAYIDACTIRRVDGSTELPTPTPCPTTQPCPTCTVDGECACATVSDVATIVAGREPVRWPR